MLTEAHDACLAAVALDPQFVPALKGLGYLEGARGNIGRVGGERESKIVSLETHGGGRIDATSFRARGLLRFPLPWSIDQSLIPEESRFTAPCRPKEKELVVIT